MTENNPDLGEYTTPQLFNEIRSRCEDALLVTHKDCNKVAFSHVEVYCSGLGPTILGLADYAKHYIYKNILERHNEGG